MITEKRIRELREIVTVVAAGGSESVDAEWAEICDLALSRSPAREVQVNNLLAALDAKQAKIDALMLEFCPGEMSDEQRREWASNQRRVDPAALRESPPADGVDAMDAADALVFRIHEYLSSGGYWNPESMEHDKVRDLLTDCQTHLAARLAKGGDHE